MFVDASVLVAVLTLEADAPSLADRLAETGDLFTSPIGLFETVVSVTRKSRKPPEFVSDRVRSFLRRADIEIRPIDTEIGERALAAYARYGKGQGHPAQLNLGDCFAYAMAKQYGVPLFYKGDDFAQTDLADRSWRP
jgi:ribonuclease VapC